MEAKKLYRIIENDFIKPNITDVNWAARMPDLDEYLFPAFKQNGGIGLMCDFTNEVKKVYTTVFLSDNVFSKLINGDISDAMLFSHHPTNWDLREHNGNYAPCEAFIIKLKERNVSIYVLHHPLDNYGKYSTCKTLADALGLNIEKPAFLYDGAMCGVIGITDCKSINELSDRYSQVVGHKTSLYKYGLDDIQNKKIAVCPGGGNMISVAEEMLENDVKTLITGCTLINEYSRETHKYEKKNKINLLGGTHYSSEKFAPMKMCEYFNDLGLSAEFIEDEPDLYDL
jgi:putative NIF3 family GTP cyclohydrolase 1 type 2